jgi:hypothetical protein
MGNKQEAQELLRRASAYVTEVEKTKLSRRNAIAQCQKAIELYLRAIYRLLGLEFHFGHESLCESSRRKQRELLQQECAKLQGQDLPMLFPYRDQLPKTAFVQFLWSDLRDLAESAEQGPGAVSANAFLGGEEIRLVREHAGFCYKVCKSLLDLKV